MRNVNYLSKNLIELRKRNNLSQEELANITGTSRYTISAYEKATREPKLDFLVSLSKKFDISIDDLITKYIWEGEDSL